MGESTQAAKWTYLDANLGPLLLHRALGILLELLLTAVDEDVDAPAAAHELHPHPHPDGQQHDDSGGREEDASHLAPVDLPLARRRGRSRALHLGGPVRLDLLTHVA